MGICEPTNYDLNFPLTYPHAIIVPHVFHSHQLTSSLLLHCFLRHHIYMTGLEIKLMKKRATNRGLNVNSPNVNNIHHLLPTWYFLCWCSCFSCCFRNSWPKNKEEVVDGGGEEGSGHVHVPARQEAGPRHCHGGPLRQGGPGQAVAEHADCNEQDCHFHGRDLIDTPLSVPVFHKLYFKSHYLQ